MARSIAAYRRLLDHSLQMALSAMEIYNKPDFKAREQIFPILLVSAWEALFKARLLKRRRRMSALYIHDAANPTGFRTNRSGNYLTTSLHETIKTLADAEIHIPSVAMQNIERLVEVRDAATHLTAASKALPYLVYMLGAASLRNYARLAHEWFGIGLSRYDFYILPLGFSYPFQKVRMAAVPDEPEAINRLLDSIAWDQEHGAQDAGGYFFLVEIKTSLVSAKKVGTDTDWTARVASEQEEGAALVVRRDVSIIDRYPYTFSDIWRRVKEEVTSANQGDLLRLLREHNVRGNPQYASYNFRSKAEERRGPGPTTAIVYNEDCLRWLVSEIRRIYST